MTTTRPGSGARVPTFGLYLPQLRMSFPHRGDGPHRRGPRLPLGVVHGPSGCAGGSGAGHARGLDRQALARGLGQVRLGHLTSQPVPPPRRPGQDGGDARRDLGSRLELGLGWARSRKSLGVRAGRSCQACRRAELLVETLRDPATHAWASGSSSGGATSRSTAPSAARCRCRRGSPSTSEDGASPHLADRRRLCGLVELPVLRYRPARGAHARGQGDAGVGAAPGGPGDGGVGKRDAVIEETTRGSVSGGGLVMGHAARWPISSPGRRSSGWSRSSASSATSPPGGRFVCSPAR